MKFWPKSWNSTGYGTLAPGAPNEHVLAGLAGRWRDLDAFEGDDYARVVTEVRLADGTAADAFVYVLRSDAFGS